MNGFYQGYAMPVGTLSMMCVGELCWAWVVDQFGEDVLVTDQNAVFMKLIDSGGGIQQ